jgi:hypothetical protein
VPGIEGCEIEFADRAEDEPDEIVRSTSSGNLMASAEAQQWVLDPHCGGDRGPQRPHGHAAARWPDGSVLVFGDGSAPPRA